jgi:hypothetical protein
MGEIGRCQIIMTTHSLVSQRDAAAVDEVRLEPVTDHNKVMWEFCADPEGFVQAAIAE